MFDPSLIPCLPMSLQKPLLIFQIRRVSYKVSVTSLYDFFMQHLPSGEINTSQEVSATGTFVRDVPSQVDI